MAEKQSSPSEAGIDEKQGHEAVATDAGVESKDDQPIPPVAATEAADDPSSAIEQKKSDDNGNDDKEDDEALDDGQRSAEVNSKPTSPVDTIDKSAALEDKSDRVDGITESEAASSPTKIALESNDSSCKNVSADKSDKIEPVAGSDRATPTRDTTTDQKNSPSEQITAAVEQKQQQQQPVVDKVNKTGACAASPQEEKKELAPSAEKSTLPTAAAETQPLLPERVARWVEKAATSKEAVVLGENKDGSGIEDDNKAIALDHDDESEARLQIDERDEDEPCEITKRRHSSGTSASSDSQKSQKAATHIIRRSIRCLNKMHTMEGDEKKAQDSPVDLKQCAADAEQELNNKSPKMPQSQQNGAALPEEAASAERLIGNVTLKKEPRDSYDAGKQHSQSFQAKSPKMHADQSKLGRAGAGQQQRGISTKSSPFDDYHHQQQQQQLTSPYRETRKRRSLESSCHAVLSANGSPSPKKFCTDQREQYINSLIGSDKFNAEQLAARADQLRAEVQDLDELARAKEMEWNEILSMRKLKEEAYLRIERRRQIMGFMESNGTDAALPLASLSLALHHQQQQQQQQHQQQQQQQQEMKKEDRHSRASSKATANYHPPNKQQHQQQPNQQLLENGPKQQQLLDLQNSEHNRQIGEGRQGAIVDVRSIIADYRLRHPAETVPKRRGRRMRNSVNVGLGAGGAMVETLGGMDSRPSSTDSCKSNTNNLVDPNTTMSFKDVLVQFAKLSQQQGEPIKTPQNYPDVTLHPVVPTPTTAAVTSSQSSNPPSSGSLLHGILTKSQSPRPTTFSPTLARLLTAPERERNSSASITNLQPSNAHLAHAYQGANPVSISNFLSSSKARTEITITPVVNNMSQSQANNLIHVDDGDDEVIEEKDSRLSMGARDNKEDREVPPRCQGCHERTAQFVCAGCGNQWYCSRECQVAAWDDHSEVCSG
ncbi:putative mediator of RNA polymerase II transcription subunit 26 isoform X2 [Trichogramma pretiosum]|uniref:putative mediator of RNA polymerase II transcription subunit 26 isoform X2 n=1 Tax=Trichogramma pretiosum TaxID=7493 RepID=UPI0006C99357|nr:putative mediator of RNA polymerase II transcription subunit 26 isoform X2 [Trichogramma pretiosum]